MVEKRHTSWVNIRPYYLVSFFAYFVLFAYLSCRFGGDGTPDFKIYHFYNGYTAYSGGRPQDIDAAQIQSYFFPLLDLLYYALTKALNERPTALLIVFSIPTTLAAFLVFLIGLTMLPLNRPFRHVFAWLLGLFGCISAASLPTLGTSMSEWVAGIFLLAAVWTWLSAPREGAWRYVVFAGLCAGLAVGLKLTNAPYFIGLLAAIFIAGLGRPMRAFRHGVLFAGAGALACVVVAGWWWWHLYATYGNPLFPFYNDIFKSDWTSWSRFADDRFKPINWLMALVYPLYWSFTPSIRVIELYMRDAHILIGLVAAVIVLVAAAANRVRTGQACRDDHVLRVISLAIFFIVAYALWEFLFSIYRYLSVLESLCGVMALGALVAIINNRWQRVAAAGLAMLLCLSAAKIDYPWWSRSRPATHAVEVALPNVAPDSLIIMLDSYAMSWLVPFLPPSVHVVGANTNFVRPTDGGRLQSAIAARIRNQQGQLWGLENGHDFPGSADQALSYYGLIRTQNCIMIKTNIDDPNTRMCELTRSPK